MATHLTCPKCASTVESATGEATPTRCTSCGARLTCPNCGTPLGADTVEPGRLACIRCGAQLGGTETLLDSDVHRAPARSSLLLPGFEILREIGRGGMGIVYAATQLQLQRQVALKVLPPILAADPVHLNRFRNEARISAQLAKSHVLPIIDIKDAQGVPVLVLPLIEGATLARILRDRQTVRAGTALAHPHPWATLEDRAYLGKMLPLLDQMVDAVTAIHQAHVLHRDIKPSNVLVDQQGEAWLSDFGLARLEMGAGTSPGVAVGTRGYMSPEQARGEDIDARADLFALGVTIYQAVTLRLPYAREVAVEPPEPPSRCQPLLASDFDAVLLKCLAADRDKRYGSTVEFRDDWRSVRQGLLPQAIPAGPVQRLRRRIRRHPWTVAAGLAALLLLGIVAALLIQGPPANNGGPDATVYRAVHVTTSPPGARVALVPLGAETGEPEPALAIRPEGHTPLSLPRVAAGRYLIVADVPGHGFHEVYRWVPKPAEAQLPGDAASERADGSVELPEIRIPPKNVVDNMAYFGGGEFTMGTPDLNLPPHPRTVAPFYLDTTEVTVGAFRSHIRHLPPDVVKKLPADDHAMVFVTFFEAMACAEAMGKRLPNEAEYEFAATQGGKRNFPWTEGESEPLRKNPWLLEAVGKPAFDHTPTKPKVYGLYSNVAEWTTSWQNPYPGNRGFGRELLAVTRVVRGGSWSVISGEPDPHEARLRGPRHREGVYVDRRHPGLGFRCARSAMPRFLE